MSIFRRKYEHRNIKMYIFLKKYEHRDAKLLTFLKKYLIFSVFVAPKWTQFEGQQKAACRKLKANASKETHDLIGRSGATKRGGKKGTTSGSMFGPKRAQMLTARHQNVYIPEGILKLWRQNVNIP